VENLVLTLVAAAPVFASYEDAEVVLPIHGIPNHFRWKKDINMFFTFFFWFKVDTQHFYLIKFSFVVISY